jgi:hypothetical protein
MWMIINQNKDDYRDSRSCAGLKLVLRQLLRHQYVQIVYGYEFCRHSLQKCGWQIRQTVSGEFSRRCRENPPTQLTTTAPSLSRSCKPVNRILGQ